MESASLLSSKPMLRPPSKLSFGHGNLSFRQTKHYVRNHQALNFKPLGTCSSQRVAETSPQIIEELVTDEEGERIKTLIMQIKEIFRSMNDGETSPSAYDTAWVARIPSKEDPTKLQFPTTLDWILENQHEDGSWGNLASSYYMTSFSALYHVFLLFKNGRELKPIFPKVTDEEGERIKTLIMQIKEKFRSMNDGETSPSAYDTAWVARIPSKEDPTKLQFPTTLDWILENQHEDGSWGEPSFFLLYDRLLCTLSCVLALQKWSRGEAHISEGLKFLRAHAEQLEKQSVSLMTCGFEIVFPSMLNEAKVLGLSLPYDSSCLTNVLAMREKKINRIPADMMHSVHTTLLYSLEALPEVVQWRRILKLQSRDGSFLSSISATAAAYMNTGDTKCLEFLTNIIKRFGDHAPCQYPVDLQERIWAIDTIERLGIDYHFREEISETLDYVYRNIGRHGVSWGRDNPIPDIDDACMALRLLRLHGYPVSADVLELFKDNNGDFMCFPGETHRGVSDMFNLYRFSQISFPGEKILEEAKSSIEQYLHNCVNNNQMLDKWSLKKALYKEVNRALRYPWKTHLQRLEAREYINHYGDSDVWIAKTVYWMHNVNNSRYLELAKLDYNRLHAMYIIENTSVLRWWKHSRLHDTVVTRVCPQEIHFSIAAALYDPEFKECRIAYTKSNCIENILKDLFHNHESFGELKLFCQAVKQWNPSVALSLPLMVREAFMGMYDTLNELAMHASNAQGKDVFPYLHDLRLKQIQDYLKIREMRERKHFGSWEEYIETGKKECGVAIRLFPAMFLMGEQLHDDDLRCLDNQSRIHDQLSLYLRLLTDIKMYENMTTAESAAPIHSYMSEENYTEEEALSSLKRVAEDAFHELVHEYLKPTHVVPRCCRRLMFEHGRVTHFFLDITSAAPNLYKERIHDAMDSLLSAI